MTLDKIWALNDKQLVALFAEPAANELTKNFAYTCALMPETCAAIFTSFGSELKARTAVKEHLLDHLRELVSRARGACSGLPNCRTCHCRESTAPGNTEDLLEFDIPSGNILKFNWSSRKIFMTRRCNFLHQVGLIAG